MVPPPAVLSILTGGPWMLFSREVTVNGTVRLDPDAALGLNPYGIILYHPSGYMSANMASTNSSQRPTNIAYPYKKDDPFGDWALVGQHSLAYSGPFSFTGRNEEPGKLQGELRHGPLIVANVPSFTERDQLRNFTLEREGGEEGPWIMNLSTFMVGNGTISKGSLLWRRFG